MQQIWRILDMGFRAAVWKSMPNPPVVGLAAVAGWAALAMVIDALQQCVTAGGPAWWSPYGFNALTTFFALVLIATAFFFRAEVRATALCAFLVFWIVTDLVSIAYEEVVFIVTGTTWELKSGFWTARDSEYLVFVVHVVWWFGAMLAIFRSVDPRKYSSHLAPLIGLSAVVFGLIFVLPHDPIFKARNFDAREANLWEYVRATWNGDREQETPTRTVASAAEAARVERSQPALLEQWAASLSPQRPGVADIYVVGVSGWADQEVFRKELDGAFDAFSRSFGTQGRTLKLINDPETVAVSPMATRQNFAAAVRSVARVMDRQEDILLLFLTSHGDKRGVALQFSGLVYGGLTPEDVAAVLTEEGIRNRIVIVSACYSGVFVKPLADDNTIVLTAADENSTSFGCANERAWTYFGDALLNQSLLPGRNLETAFDAAKGLIAEWEARDGISPSNPQAHFGVALKEKLSAVYDFARSAERNTLSP
jgi:Peptidase C13 family